MKRGSEGGREGEVFYMCHREKEKKDGEVFPEKKGGREEEEM
jgi:hypothetical protein